MDDNKRRLPVCFTRPADKRFLRILACLTLAGVCLLPVWQYSAMAAEAPQDTRKVVRVGLPIQENVSKKTEDGAYVGYTVDYLNELIRYTDWEIEYVEAEGDINTQLATLSDMLDVGEIDMLGMMNISEYLQELYLYPTYSYGNTYTAIAVAQDSPRWQSDDFQRWDGMKVATFPGLEHRMEQLAQYAAISGFTYQTIEYQTLDEVLDAVRSGEADACVQVDIQIPDGLRAIARFNPAPYYFALAKNRTDLLRELNSAMSILLESYPSLQSELYSRYYLHQDSFQLSEEDRAWVAQLEPLNILYFIGNAPIQDEADGEAVGVAANFMEAFSNAVGLKMIPVFARSYEEASSLIADGMVDIIAATSGVGALDSDSRIRLSLPYFESSAVWVVKGSPEIDHESRPLLPANAVDELNDLKHHTENASLLDAYCASYYLRKNVVYDKLYVEWANRDTILYSVGFLPSADVRLLSIFNSFANSLSDQTKQSMLYANSRAPFRYTLSELIEIYRWQISLLLISLVLLALLLSRIRRNRIMRETAAEIERLRQFSIMINECIIKYEARQDRLIMQNNTVVFQDQEILQPFLAENAVIQFRNENERRYTERLREMLRNQLTVSELELIQDGAPRWYRIDLAYLDSEYTIGRLSDINEEIRHRTLLEREASHDALTGMMNRSALQHSLRSYLESCQEGVFLILDLDNFKKVNDTLGHREGDRVLQVFAAFLGIAFRAEDYKARLGGDEFVVFLPVKMTEDALRDKLEQFLQDVSRKVFADYQSCELSVSIGAAFVNEDFHSFEALYREADSSMYAAKYGGKNSYFISDGSICTRQDCTGCRETCRRRDYLITHGITNPRLWNPNRDAEKKAATQ